VKIPGPSTVFGRIAVVTAALVAAFLADLAVGAARPGLTAAVALASSVVLVVGAKSLVAPIVSRPAGSRVGEVGDPCDDLGPDPWTDERPAEADRA
jgi:hypothetical protein